MTATIYVTKEAWTTSKAIKDLDYYDRCILSDDEATDPTRKEGYYLKNMNMLTIAPIPQDARIILSILPKNEEEYSAHISFPTHLRGCIFERAPHLPKYYKEIIQYWSGETLNSNIGGAAYYQNPANAYMVDLSALYENPDIADQRQSVLATDALVSEGVVMHAVGLGHLVQTASDDAFIEIEMLIDEKMLGLDNGEFMTKKNYNSRLGERTESIFLLVSDIRNSPDPDSIFIDILRYEELDYGFYY